MSIESLRNRIAQLQKDKARLETQLSSEREKARKKQAEIAQIARSVNKNTSASSLSSKQRQIESKQGQLNSYEKKAADLQVKLADKNTELLRKLNELESAEKHVKRRRDQEEKARQEQQLRHSRQVTRELEKQSQLHSKLSSAPIVVRFADLPKKITVLFIASNPNGETPL